MVTVTAVTAMEAMMVMMATLGQVRWRVQVKYYSAMFSTDNAASWSKPRPRVPIRGPAAINSFKSG
jgi:hypothetical protein